MNMLAVENFPIIRSALPASELPLFSNTVAAINHGLKAKAIAAAAFSDIKDALNSIVQRAWTAVVDNPFFCDGRWRNQSAEMQELHAGIYVAGLQSFKSIGKKLLGVRDRGDAHEAMGALAGEVAPLVTAVDCLREFVQKRKRVTQEAVSVEDSRNTVLSPAGTVARDLLAELAESANEGLVRWFQRSYTVRLTMFLEAGEQRRRDLLARDPLAAAVIERCVDQAGDGKPGAACELYQDYESRLQDLVREDAEAIKDNFIYRNLGRIAAIVDGKGDFLRAEMLGATVDLTGLSGTLSFRFADGSRFSIQNAVRWSQSVLGRAYLRQPLTFHDVFFGDGERMRLPSEEKMLAEFKTRQKVERPSKETVSAMLAGMGVDAGIEAAYAAMTGHQGTYEEVFDWMTGAALDDARSARALLDIAADRHLISRAERDLFCGADQARGVLEGTPELRKKVGYLPTLG